MTDRPSAPPPDPPVSMLFVCLGNICRSPLAEGVFQHLASDSGLTGAVEVDSAGTGAWHVGNSSDPRAIEVAQRHGITLGSRARQVREEDFFGFDLILAMDRSNLRDLEALRDGITDREPTADLRLFREFDPEADGDLDVPDPYFGGPGGFDTVYEMIVRTCRGILEETATGNHREINDRT
jgi:protein-tyrosine phosphatase